jgi:hypothetical protein
VQLDQRAQKQLDALHVLNLRVPVTFTATYGKPAPKEVVAGPRSHGQCVPKLGARGEVAASFADERSDSAGPVVG